MGKIRGGEGRFAVSDFFRLTRRLGVGDVGTGGKIFFVLRETNFFLPFLSRRELSSSSEMLSKLKSSIPGCRAVDAFGELPQNQTGPNWPVLNILFSQEGASASGSSFELVPETPTSSFALNGRLSTSISLVAGKDDGGLDEFRLGVRSGTDNDDDEGNCGKDGGVARVLYITVSHAEEEAFEFTTLLNAAVAGNGGKMTSAGKICGC